MPLEQIRPLLSLVGGTSGNGSASSSSHAGRSCSPPTNTAATRCRRRRRLSQTSSDEDDDDSNDSPTSPHDQDTIAGSVSGMLGPSSPSVRSNKDLHESPLYKLGRVDGVTRSGSGSGSGSGSSTWRGHGGISVIGRGQGGDASVDSSSSTPTHTYSDSADHPHGTGLSRTNTVGSASSYSAAAFSLRSVSSSSRSATSSATTPSASPPGSIRTLDSSTDTTKLARHKSDVSHLYASRNRNAGSEQSGAGTPPDDYLKRHSSFVGPGISRIKSIGRGASSSYAPSPSLSYSPPPPPTNHPARNSPSPPPSRIKSIGRGASSGIGSPSSAWLAGQSAPNAGAEPTSPLSPSSPAANHFRESSALTATSSASSDTTIRPPAAPSPLTPASPPTPAAPRITNPSPRHHRTPLSPRQAAAVSPVPSPRASPRPWQTYFSRSNPASPDWQLEEQPGFPFPGSPPRMAATPNITTNRQGASVSLASAVDYPNLPPPRKHTGGYLRTRSALSRSIASYGASDKEQVTPFAGVGEEGGRRAARARARHPSLANLDNAPFSVLEEMRAWGLRAGFPRPTIAVTQPPSTSSAASTASPHAPNTQDANTTSTPHAGPAVVSASPLPPLQSGRDSPHRPLSPIAHASPDAQWALAAGVASPIGREPLAFASMASLSDAISDVGTLDGSDGERLREATLLAPISPPPPPSDRAPSPGLVAAAHAASTAVGVEDDKQRTITSPIRRQRSRPSIIPVVEGLSSPSRDLSRAASPSVSAGGSEAASSPPPPSVFHARPRMSRSTTFANPSTLSPGVNQQQQPHSAGPAMPGTIATGVPAVTHVLRTPTTEEWARYLASQGLDMASHSNRPRSSTGRGLVGLASQSRRSVAHSATRGSVDRLAMSAGASADEVTMSAHGVARGDADDSEDDADEVASAIFEQSTVSLDDLIPDYPELPGTDEADRGRWGGIPIGRRLGSSAAGSARSRSSSSSSDSSQGRMEALHAVISMPPSRRGSPPGSPTLDTASGYDFYPGLQSRRGSEEGRKDATALDTSGNAPAGGATALSTSPLAAVQDPSLTQHVQQLHGYTPAAQGQRRTIDDFDIIDDIGRGAYGLVKLARLKSLAEDGEAVGRPEFVVKYIIKSRILADCWRRHRILGPIPVEIHVMDQLRRLRYLAPTQPSPWDPQYLWGTSPKDYPPALRDSPSSSTPATPMPRRKASLMDDASEREEDEEHPHATRERQNSQTSHRTETTPRGSINHGSQEKETHPALGTMLDFFEDESFYYLVMPRFGHGTDLFDYIESHPYGLLTREARCILGQVADGLRFLHEHNIVHRDIKDENVILDGSGHAQLIDFGSATHVRPGRLFDTFSGTLDYAAAEILRGDKYAGKEQDVWAMGVVAYVCLVGDAPFWNGEEAMCGLQEGSRAMIALEERCASEPETETGSEGGEDTPTLTAEQRAILLNERGQDLAGQSDGGGRLLDAKDLIENCLALDPRERPTAATLCRHVFLAGHGSGMETWSGWKGWQRA